MATLVLTAVGTLVGGPIGGALGALIGNQVDHALLAPKGRQGPRLSDLSVQTSSYGAAIPRLFGTMRVAGTVIWATDLREDSTTAGGGKSGPRTTTYSYSASFGVALSARPILSVGRIWADGNLLRGSAGDWKSETGFRLYLGGEDQAVDPLIAGAEGIDATPAHRGIAYAVFEGLQLADFGNRIPSLTFEVTADTGDVAVAAIATELSGGTIVASGGVALGGYAASGDSVRGALEALASACPMPLRDDGAALRIDDPDPVALDEAAFGSDGQGNDQPAHVRDRQSAATLPDAVSIAYLEPTRDYQAGLQRAQRDGIGRREDRIELPAAIAADLAKGLADGALQRAWRERDRATVRVPWRLLDARAGALASLPDGSLWRVSEWTLDHMALELKLTRAGPPLMTAAGADAGRATSGPDAEAGATRLTLLDLPGIDDSAIAPAIWLAAAGTGAGWRRATASQSLDSGASWSVVGQTALPAVMGSAAGVLGPGPSTLFDRANAVEIDLLNAGMALRGADDAALVGLANVAALGDEIIQFGDAVQIGARRWRLGRLLRGRRGTEWAIDAHAAGEAFVLLDPAGLHALDMPLSAIGATLSVTAIGPGDGGIPATVSIGVVGRALCPPAPVHLDAVRLDDGTIRFTWVRRSRAGWTWLDDGDAPLGEDTERYRIQLTPSVGDGRTVELGVPSYDYDADAQAADGVAGTITIHAAIAQLGSRGASVAATGTWTL